MKRQRGHSPHTLPRGIIYLFFGLGVFSATAFRAIIVAERVAPEWVRPIWYAATLGYVVFFIYRFYITRKRKHAIEEFGLMEKIESGRPITGQDREVLLYLVRSVEKSPEDMNYLIIFVLSILAILLDLFVL